MNENKPTASPVAQAEARTVVEKSNCFVVVEDGAVIGSFAGPNAEQHANQFAVVLENGAESNMTGGVYAELPESSVKDGSGYVAGTIFTIEDMRAFADATHAIRVAASHGQAPAGATVPVAVVTRFHDLGGEIDWTGRTILPVGAHLYAQAAPTAQAAPAAGAVAGPNVTVRVGAQEFDLASTGEHFTAADMHTASAQAFREGQAAAAPTPAAQADSGATELAEADRRAGAAERALAACREDLTRFERVRDQMKDQWGASRNTSFDVVWAEALALKADSGVQEDAARGKGLSSLSVWWAMHEAQWELCGDVVPDDAVILAFMGSGASTQVTAGDLRAALAAKGGKQP